MNSVVRKPVMRPGVDPEAIESIEQFASMWRVFVGDRGNTDVTDRPDLAIRWVDSAFPFWNMIFLTERLADPQALASALRDSAASMRTRREAGLVCVCEDYLDASTLASLPAAISEAGLEFAMTMHGMAGDFLPISPPTHPSLQFVRVTTEEHLQAYADINANGYGMPLEAGRAGLAGSALWKGETMHTYLGYENGVPVSAAATVANDGCLFLALVATTPAAQRKGYGDATVRKALFEGAQATGLTRTVLHATDAGFPVYQRIGYHKVSTIQAYRPRA